MSPNVPTAAREAHPTGGSDAPPMALDDAYAYCARVARAHYENFNVGGWITPRKILPHVYAIYAWCRMVDDLGDEAGPSREKGELATAGRIDAAVATRRLELLDWWESELERSYSGQATHAVAVAIQHTVQTFGIPKEPFLRLIHANRMDQGTGRFPDLNALLDYCEHSANPVGHLFLHLFGYSDPERQRLADCTCTALQLTNFWQDVSRDYHDRGRIYLPQQDMARFGVSEANIALGQATDGFRALLTHECDLAMDYFREGAQLISSLDRPARLPVALFTRGGTAILDAIRKRNYDVLAKRPALSKSRKAWLLLSTWVGCHAGFGYGLPKP